MADTDKIVGIGTFLLCDVVLYCGDIVEIMFYLIRFVSINVHRCLFASTNDIVFCIDTNIQ